jgi:hypothetical protein
MHNISIVLGVRTEYATVDPNGEWATVAHLLHIRRSGLATSSPFESL